jgi:DNA-binding transcriptional ArsR family regulator
MSSIFPLRDTVTPDENREPRLVDLDEDTADEVFEALASQTTRKIFLELHHSPQTTSDLAEATDTSVQNVQYHLEKLTDADLVEVVDTWYSERGTEMNVYAPEDESLVLFAGQNKQRTLRSLLNRVMGVLGVLVPGSILAALGAQRIPTGGETATSPGNTGTDGGTSGNASTASDGAGNGDARAGDGDAAENTETGGISGEDAGNVGVESTDSDPAIADGGQQFAPNDSDTAIDAANGTADTIGNASQAAADNTSQQMVENASQQMADNATAAADAAASIDPALAAGLGFFAGGLLIFAALTVWYGNW